MNLVLYSDGLQIHTLPAKPFDDPATANVLRDVVDGWGAWRVDKAVHAFMRASLCLVSLLAALLYPMHSYFPYVLKRDFPDGVPLRLVDRSHESIANSPSRRAGEPQSRWRARQIRTTVV